MLLNSGAKAGNFVEINDKFIRIISFFRYKIGVSSSFFISIFNLINIILTLLI